MKNYIRRQYKDQTIVIDDISVAGIYDAFKIIKVKI